MNRVFKALAIAFTVVVALVSCKKEDQPKEVALTGIELNATSQTLQVGQEFQLTVTYKPENATNKPAATWASDTPAVATVDGGKVVAVAAGTAKITATVGTFKAECAVTVASAEEEILPVEGNSDWSIIGALLGANWDKDFVAAKDGDIYVVKNVKLAADNQFKFRKDKDWGVNRGAEGDVEPYKLTAGTAINVVHNGKNLSAPGDGIYDIYYNAAVEQVCLVAKDGTPKWNEPEPEGLIAIDGDFSDWAEIEAVSNGTHKEFKVALDDNYLYLYTKRVKGEGDAASGYEEMWGHSGEGYVYVALDLDKNPETGEMLWSNGPYEFVGYSWPFGGSASAPEIRENPGASNTNCAPSTCTMKNILCKGVIGTDEVTIEYRIPRADLPAIPETPFIVYSWGSLGLDRAEYHVGEAQPVKEYVHDYTPSAEYLAETNLWKAVDAAGSDFFIINCINGEWPRSAEASSEGVYALTHEQSTYKMHYDVASTEDWQRQLFLFPKAENAIAIEEGEKYNVKVTFYANKDLPRVFMKVVNYQADKDNKEGSPLLFGDEIKSVKAGQPTVFEYKDVAGAANTENLTFVIDFGGAPADVDIYVKDIILEKVGGTPASANVVKVTPDLLPTAYVKDDGGSYIESRIASGDVQFNIFTVANYGSGIQIRKEGGYVSNHTSFGKIEQIKVTVFEGKSWYPTNLVLYAGTEENPSATVIEAKSDDASSTFDLSAGAYTHFTLMNTSTYAVYLDNIEVSYTGDAVTPSDPAPAANIKLDGDLSDWDAVEGVEAGSFKEFKFASDADNIYMYFKIKREKIIAAKTEPFVFNWRRYIAFGIDADNNAETGTAVTFAGMSIPGCEIGGNFYPFRGTASAASGTDGVEIVNGVEEQGGVTTEIGSNVPDGADKKVSAFGKVDDEFVYVEAGFARADVGSPAAGTIKIQLSLAWDLTDILEYSLK